MARRRPSKKTALQRESQGVILPDGYMWVEHLDPLEVAAIERCSEDANKSITTLREHLQITSDEWAVARWVTAPALEKLDYRKRAIADLHTAHELIKSACQVHRVRRQHPMIADQPVLRFAAALHCLVLANQIIANVAGESLGIKLSISKSAQKLLQDMRHQESRDEKARCQAKYLEDPRKWISMASAAREFSRDKTMALGRSERVIAGWLSDAVNKK